MKRLLQACRKKPHIAYFSMEIALQADIPTYSGGLGILAGDTLRSAADLGLSLMGVTLISRAGYLRQEIDAQGRQIEHPEPWEPEKHLLLLGSKITLEIEDREVWVRPWLYSIEGAMGSCVPIILLDTDLEENHPEDRAITTQLYGGDDRNRLRQEAVLGIGGIRMLAALGLQIRAYHLNEGHSALLAMELGKQYERVPGEISSNPCSFHIETVKECCIFTTHTPVEAGQDHFNYPLVERQLGNEININDLKMLAGDGELNMTRLALNLSGYVNGVAKSHAEVSRKMFPGYSLHAITNGVHPRTWTCPSITELYDRHIPGWLHEPDLLVRADQIPDTELWDRHQHAKQKLIAYTDKTLNVKLDIDTPILGFARRMTGYKRPDMLFNDIERLLAIHDHHPFQLVLAGKAHPADQQGKDIIEKIHRLIRELAGRINIVFLPDYNMSLAKILVAGADVWLNNPIPPLEASGTSGMKAAFNGVPNLSVRDGWWTEGCIEGVTGWAIGDQSHQEHARYDADSLYDKLQHTVLPLYHGDKSSWIAVMKGAISKNAYYFNTHRMMRRYATEAYNRC